MEHASGQAAAGPSGRCSFNDQFGNIEWTDADRVQRLITEEIPRKVAEDEAYQNAQKNNDPANARVEHDRALGRVMMAVLRDDTELFKQFSDVLRYPIQTAEDEIIRGLASSFGADGESEADKDD